MIETLGRISFQNPQQEKLPIRENSSLLSHIQHFKKNFRQEDLPYDWYDLPGTGFMVNKQIDLIFSDFKPDDSEIIRKKKKETALKRTDQDIRGFILEYLSQGLIFPIKFHVDSEGNLIDKNYGNKKVIDTISSEERSGVVKATFAEKIEPFLVNAADGSIAVMISPSGWSGLSQENGKSITYPDSQTYVFQKIKDQVLGFTIRTDFSNCEHREVLTRLTGKIIPQDLGIRQFVESPALIAAQTRGEAKSIKDVVDVMRLSRQDVSGSGFVYKNRLWEEVYRDLGRREELWRYSEFTERIAQEFKDYFLKNNLTRQETKEALAVTMLRIAKFLGEDSVRPKNEKLIFRTSNHNDLYVSPKPQFSYGKVLEEVQERPGCAGGGNSSTSLVKSITPRIGSSNPFEQSLGACCENMDDNHYHCPECKKKYSDETSKSPEQRTKQCGCGFKFGC